MKFFHIGDLHFGKTLCDVQLVEKDQPFWVERLLAAVDEYGPDAVVIAGDVYDRSVPSPEAMKLFEHLVVELSKRDKYVFIIPGNHDSSVRLSHVSELLTAHKIYIAGELKRELEHVTVSKDGVDVTFWLMPYIFPKLVSGKQVLDKDGINTYDEAARQLIAAQDIDSSVCNVLVAHQNVLANGVAPEHSESETIIGGIGEIDVSAFDAFDYVALGHIHNAQKVGRETVRYAGCPIFYDFSEINRKKDLTMVSIGPDKSVKIDFIELPVLHRLEQFEKPLSELLEIGAKLKDKDRLYVKCIIEDKHIPPRAQEQLKAVFGDCLVRITRKVESYFSAAPAVQGGGRTISLEEQFANFYQEQQNELLDSVQEGLVKKIVEQQSRSGDYVSEASDIPESDSKELLDYLFSKTEEDA